MQIQIIGSIRKKERIASGSKIRELDRLNRVYGKANWRKQKGIAIVSIGGSIVGNCEIHWYEARGIGKKEIKIKRILDER